MALLDSITAALFGSKESAASKAQQKKYEDMRSVVRVPQRMRGGFLWHDRLLTPRPVLIKDLSVNGARVQIVGDPIKASLLADGVSLYFSSEKHEVKTSVAWIKGQTLGLRFEGRPRPPTRKYPAS